MSGLEILLLVLLAILPWGEGGASPTALAVVQCLMLSAVALVIGKGMKRGRIRLSLTYAHAAFALLLLIGAVGLMRAEYLFAAFETWWEQALWLLVAVGLAAIFLFLFLKAVKGGQFDDLDDPPRRILKDY